LINYADSNNTTKNELKNNYIFLILNNQKTSFGIEGNKLHITLLWLSISSEGNLDEEYSQHSKGDFMK